MAFLSALFTSLEVSEMRFLKCGRNDHDRADSVLGSPIEIQNDFAAPEKK
jgi:hypothetical protein